MIHQPELIDPDRDALRLRSELIITINDLYTFGSAEMFYYELLKIKDNPLDIIQTKQMLLNLGFEAFSEEYPELSKGLRTWVEEMGLWPHEWAVECCAYAISNYAFGNMHTRLPVSWMRDALIWIAPIPILAFSGVEVNPPVLKKYSPWNIKASEYRKIAMQKIDTYIGEVNEVHKARGEREPTKPRSLDQAMRWLAWTLVESLSESEVLEKELREFGGDFDDSSTVRKALYGPQGLARKLGLVRK